MRKIRFRGKRLYDNKWVYGSLEQDRYNSASIIDEETAIWHEVDPETVGQYADNGLCEGDIVEVLHSGEKYVIVWHDNGLMLQLCDDLSYYLGINHWYPLLKVIGNIHDNKPEVSK